MLFIFFWDICNQSFCSSYEGFQTSWRNVQIMDADRDARAIVAFRDSLLASGRWGSDGEMIALDDPIMNDHEAPPLSPEESEDSYACCCCCAR